MCLYPKLIINRKYTGTLKNKGNAPALRDERVRFVPVGCGNCIECRKQKANEWRVRLFEELKITKHAYFITLTFEPSELEKLCTKYQLKESNAVAGKAVRMFLERIRKEYKKSVKHWLITELGQSNTERIHLHGILFLEYVINNEWLERFWKYGKCDTGQWCNGQTINYIIKYVYKLDLKHKGFVPQIFCSAGLGKNYITNFAKEKHKYRGKQTRDYYTLPNGGKTALPIYYRNKLFTEQERELLWLNRIDADVRYVRGIKIANVMAKMENLRRFNDILETAQKENIQLGYGDDSKEWRKRDYNITLRMLKKSRGEQPL
ncbi:putative VP4 [Microvirus sp.]|nr:putative VP4 [Microvirus sp.]